MSKNTITNGNILKWASQIQSWMMSGSVLAYFHQERIDTFYKVNGRRLEMLTKQLQELDDKHVLKDPEGNPITTTSPEGRTINVYKSKEDEALYNEAVSTLMAQPISLVTV